MHYVCTLFIQLLITLFSLVMIIPPLIIAVPNVLALKILLLVSGYLKSAPSSGWLVLLKSWSGDYKTRIEILDEVREISARKCAFWKMYCFQDAVVATVKTGTDEEKILEKWAIGQDADRAEYERYPDVKWSVLSQVFCFWYVVMETFHFNLS